MNFKKFLFISTILFILFSFSPIFLNSNELPSVSRIYAVSNINQQQLDQTASILNSIQGIINQLKKEIKTLFTKEVKAQADITTGLVGHWKFDEGAGTMANDSSGNNNTGTLVNGPLWTTGKIGGALGFNNNYVNTNIDDFFDITGPITLSAWVKIPSNIGQSRIIVSKDANVVSRKTPWAFGINYLTKQLYSFTASSGTNKETLTSNNLISANVWAHVVMVRDNSTVTFYINGIIDSKGAQIFNSSTITTNIYTAKIGTTDGTSNNFIGEIDDVRIYNRAFTQVEITELYNFESGIPPPSDITPPVLSSGSPSGALLSGTTQTTLSISTNENAICKYSTTPNTAYSSIAPPAGGTFITTGGTSHSQTITGFTNGTSYNYYVRCQDTAGNTNTIDYTISFSVSSPVVSDTQASTIPTNLAATAISSTQINLLWTASTDNVGVTGYKIYRCAGSACAPTVQIATSPTNSYSNTGLIASTAYTYAVSAYDAAGNESGKSANASATTLALSSNPIDNLKPGEWYEVPNSRLRDVAAVPVPPGWEGVAGVINAWSGGAYDTKRDRLIVWGGGHMSYAGNEIYAFDLNTLKWERVNEPSADVDKDGLIESSGEYPDGRPRSRHTYNYIQYVASIDRFCTFGDNAMYPSGQISTDKTRCFDFNTNQWEKMANTPSYSTGTFSAVDPVTGHAWVRGNGNHRYLSEFDPINNLWTKRTNLESISSMFEWTADIDPVRRKFVAVGGGAVYSWNIGKSGIITRETLITTGATEIINARNPGFVYDPISDKFVAWNGGADVYTLDMDTLVWSKHAPAITNTVIPTAPAQWGTYGRFRYSPSKNVFVVVNSVNQNVYIYKFSAVETPPDTTPPTLSSGSPTGTLPSGTTQTTLSVSTNENATCKYSTTANTTYASIAPPAGGTFTTIGGTSHSQIITGLTNGASYNYYVRCQDTAGNANPTDYAISFSVGVSVTVGISVTETNSITIKETEGKNTTNYPIQFGRPFVQGEIARYPQALIDGIAVETQANVKSRWSDGSVKHAIISFLIPNLTANTSVKVTFRDQLSGNNDNFVTKEMMLSGNYDFEAIMELTNGLTKAVSARAMLNADAVEYWLKGPIATTVIFADHSSTRSFDTGFDENRSFRPIFHATFWPGIKKVKVRFIGEIANTEALQDQMYALTLKTGQQSPETVYTKPAFTHYGNARWTKVFWIAGAPSKVAIDHNLAYLAKTKFIPNYDISKKVSEAAITNAYSKWTAAPKDIFDSGNWDKYMPSTGGRPDIGMYPTWAVRWLYTGDNRMEEQALGNADLSAAWPVHFREGKEGKKFLRNNSVISGLGKVLSVSDRPTINLSDFSFARTVTADKIIPVGLLTKGGWIADNAHQPDSVSPQYILTGDYWYLEELYFWASWSAANTNGAAITEPWGRGSTGAEGGIYDQVRGEAWMLRNRAHTAFVSPDSAPEKEYSGIILNSTILC